MEARNTNDLKWFETIEAVIDELMKHKIEEK